MADKSSSNRKKPVSQKRVAVVLASLVGTMTISAAALLIMEGVAPGTSVPVMATTNESLLLPANIALRSEPWRFIIIYDSADVAASADSLADGSFAGGTSPSTVRPKANFHFVIDSPESGMDGRLEVGTSWQNQSLGAPYARWPDPRSYSFTPYTNAVGVCLAADLNRKPISEAQHLTLTRLVRELQKQSSIPADQVKFQWEIGPDARPSAVQQAYAERFRDGL
jgi:hypothetical protein